MTAKCFKYLYEPLKTHTQTKFNSLYMYVLKTRNKSTTDLNSLKYLPNYPV